MLGSLESPGINHSTIQVLVAGGWTESVAEFGIALGLTSSLTFLQPYLSGCLQQVA